MKANTLISKVFFLFSAILLGMFTNKADASEGACNVRARIIMMRVARHVRSQGNIFERQSFPQLSEKDQADVKKLSMRNIKIIKKFFKISDMHMREVIAEAVYQNLSEDALKTEYPEFVESVYKFKNELLEGRSNVPPPGKQPIIMEMEN